MTRSVARLLAFAVGGLLGWALVVACTVDDVAAPERTTLGASYATTGLTVSWRATCGLITAAGAYTAPSMAPSGGRCLVIATRTDNGHADTATATIASAAVTRGRPFGPFALWTGGCAVAWGPAPFTVSQNYSDPATLVTQLACARTMGQRLVLALTGGGKAQFLTNGTFDRAKWSARLQRFNTAPLRQAIAQGVADGTIVGYSMIDEPEHRDWGTTLTKPLLTQMAAEVKAFLPTLPVGVNHGVDGYYKWRPTERYGPPLDYVMNSYSWRVNAGNVTAYRDRVLAQATLDGVTPAFTLSILDGGVKIIGCLSGPACCPPETTGGVGTFAGGAGQNCRMTAAQVRDYGRVLGVAGCVLLLWEYDGAFMARADNQAAFADLAAVMAQQPATRCGRT